MTTNYEIMLARAEQDLTDANAVLEAAIQAELDARDEHGSKPELTAAVYAARCFVRDCCESLVRLQNRTPAFISWYNKQTRAFIDWHSAT